MAVPFQIAKGLVGFWAGLNRACSGVLDYAAGSDLVWGSSTLDAASLNTGVLFRNTVEENPLTGRDAIFMQFPAAGGFVALDQRLPDGRPHPGAGTGFALCHVHAMPMDVAGDESGQAKEGLWVKDGQVYRHMELRQIRFKDGHFIFGESERFYFDELFPGWTISNKAMNAAVACGETLLWPLACRNSTPGESLDRFSTESTVGVSRWIYRDETWRIETIFPVADTFQGYEPSMALSPEGSLLLTARKNTTPEDWDKFGIPCWESTDGGESWQEVFCASRYRANSPLVIGAAASGTIFVVGNPMAGGINQRSLGYSRELLALWPLLPDLTGLDAARLLRCGQFDFGLAPTKNGWKLDHPSTAILEDENGARQTLISYRVQASDENRLKEIAPSPCSGVHIEELHL